jgi:hypothetical protein
MYSDWLNQEKSEPVFFEDQWCSLQVLRCLDHMDYGGADTGEVLKTIRSIKFGDYQGWFDAWNKTARHVETLAERLHDPVSKGKAYLRYAHITTIERQSSCSARIIIRDWSVFKRA